jgi:hypothetical protein
MSKVSKGRNLMSLYVYVSTFNVLFRKPDAMSKIRKVE